MNALKAAQDEKSIITVVGIGGGGCNAVNYMWEVGIRNVEFLICNTDQQALDMSPVSNKLRLGVDGLGAGNNPSKGRDAALESLDRIRDTFERLNTKMVFITAGMGGGTGTGAAPVVAKLAREMDILTVAIVTSPLRVEGKVRYDQAMAGIDKLRDSVDSLLIINNENIKNVYLEDPSAKEAFSKANEILASAAKGISEIITVQTSFIHVDFADVSMVLRNSGRAHMSVEREEGLDRAERVASKSLTSPLLDNSNISGAENILINIATERYEDLKYSEVNTILEYVQNNARVVGGDGEIRTANIIWGMSEKSGLGDSLELVMVATGFENEQMQFDEYERQRMLKSGDPASPFVRMDIPTGGKINRGGMGGGKRGGASKKAATASAVGVTLPERDARYPNIETLLRTPAYIARGVKLVTIESESEEVKE